MPPSAGELGRLCHVWLQALAICKGTGLCYVLVCSPVGRACAALQLMSWGVAGARPTPCLFSLFVLSMTGIRAASVAWNIFFFAAVHVVTLA